MTKYYLQKLFSSSSLIVKILQSQSKDDVTTLITSENENVPSALRMINMDGFIPENVPERRQINALLMECLIHVKMGYHNALFWLMKNVDFQICNTIINDFKYSGICFQVLMEKITWYIKLIQAILAHNIKGEYLEGRLVQKMDRSKN